MNTVLTDLCTEFAISGPIPSPGMSVTVLVSDMWRRPLEVEATEAAAALLAAPRRREDDARATRPNMLDLLRFSAEVHCLEDGTLVAEAARLERRQLQFWCS